MSDEERSLDAVRAYFAQDRFATDACGCTILEATPGHAVCAFDITDRHRNAQGAVMGGAIFTLADFALAVASNLGGSASVSISNTIEFMSATRGSRLIATATADREGRTLGFYTVEVVDDRSVLVARMVATCLRQDRPPA